MVEPVKYIRYILFTASVMVMFSNLIDCITQSCSLFEYFIYVGTLLIISLCLLFIQSDWVLAAIFGVAGIFTLLDTPTPNYLSGGVFFFVFAIKLANSKVFTFCIYFLTFLMVIASHVKGSRSPIDAINILIGYSVIYLIDHLIYNKGKRLSG